jgi:hypothetical protein
MEGNSGLWQNIETTDALLYYCGFVSIKTRNCVTNNTKDVSTRIQLNILQRIQESKPESDKVSTNMGNLNQFFAIIFRTKMIWK